jgi:hypothetical protein
MEQEAQRSDAPAPNQRDTARIKKACCSIEVRIRALQKKIDALKKSHPEPYPRCSGWKSFDHFLGQIYISIYNRTQEKLFNRQVHRYRQATDRLNEIQAFCQAVLSTTFSITVDVRGFLTAVDQSVERPDVCEVIHRAALKSLRAKLPQICPLPIPTARTVKAALQRVQGSFNTALGYLLDSDFDCELRGYLQAGHAQTFHKILDAITQFEYIPARRLLRAAVETLAKSDLQIQDNDKTSFLIVYNASTRYLFDLVTLELPFVLRNDMSIAKFVRHCEIIRNRTPAELLADDAIFMPEQRSQTVVQLFTESQELREAAAYLFTLQFFSSPLDIAYYGLQAIAVFTRSIATQIYRNKHCGSDPTAAIPPVAITELSSVVAFDHIFTYLYMAIAIDPPANALAIGEYLKAFGAFEESRRLEYASTSIQAAVEYIRNLKEE